MGMMLRAYRQIDRLAPGRNSFRPLWPLWPFTARPAGSTTRSAGSTSAAARPAPHPLDLSRELRQLIAVELAIAIRVKLHGMLDKPLG
jgi:hypothetical protein